VGETEGNKQLWRHRTRKK